MDQLTKTYYTAFILPNRSYSSYDLHGSLSVLRKSTEPFTSQIDFFKKLKLQTTISTTFLLSRAQSMLLEERPTCIERQPRFEKFKRLDDRKTKR